jgi:two-component system sensor histidine kinase CpxA
MRTFFLQLFLAFWIATVGIFLGAAILLPDGEPGSPETMRIASDASTRMLAYDVVQRYRMEGCTGIAFLSPQFKLVDENAHPLCDSSSSSDPLTIKMLATSTGTHSGRRHMGGEWIQVSAVSVESGGNLLSDPTNTERESAYLAALSEERHPYFHSCNVSFRLLHHPPYTSSVPAFRQFTDGNLDIRLPILPRRWGDLGGADVRTLMLDFNHMADRTRELLRSQKLLMRDISHELRSPLARLRVVLELAREDALEPLPWMDDIERQVSGLTDLLYQ